MNKNDVYKSQLADKVSEIRKICIQEKIPCFMSFAVKDDGNKTEYQHEMVSTGLADEPLSQNYIADFVNIINGLYAQNAGQGDNEDPNDLFPPIDIRI